MSECKLVSPHTQAFLPPHAIDDGNRSTGVETGGQGQGWAYLICDVWMRCLIFVKY